MGGRWFAVCKLLGIFALKSKLLKLALLFLSFVRGSACFDRFAVFLTLFAALHVSETPIILAPSIVNVCAASPLAGLAWASSAAALPLVVAGVRFGDNASAVLETGGP